MLRGMLLQAADRMLGERRGRVVTAVFRHGRQRAVIFERPLRIEIPVMIFQIIGMVESPVGDRLGSTEDVPLAGMIAAIAQGFEPLRQRARP